MSHAHDIHLAACRCLHQCRSVQCDRDIDDAAQLCSMGVSCVVVPSHRRIGNIGRNPGRYTGNPCSRLGPLRRHSRGGSFDHPATSGVFPSCTDRLLCRLAPDGESDFLKDRWLPGTWGSCRSAWNAEGERVPLGVKPSDRPDRSSWRRARRSGATRPGAAAAAEALEAICGPFLTRAVREREV